MKKLLFALLFSIFLTSTAMANESFTFRGIEWGLEMLDLINAVVDQEYENGLSEDNYDVKYDRFIIYNGEVAGHDCEIDYFLLDDKFADGAYIFREKHSNLELYYTDYKDLVAKYKKKYGEPQEDNKKWVGDSIYKNDSDNYGMAVGVGDLQLYTKWEADDGSIIQFRMVGDNFTIVIRIDYLCPGYYDLKAQAKTNDDEGI